MIDWLPGYEHQPINAGLDVIAIARHKAVLHTTQTGPAPSLINAWRNNPGLGLPHFLGITPDRIVQLLPLSVGAYTLQNPPGGIDTNRGKAIQIEVCEFAENAPLWSAAGKPWCNALGRWMRDLVSAGLELDLVTELAFGGQWNGMPAGDWYGFAGVCGHQHVPEQPDRHWDPGRIQIGAILAAARGNQPTPTPTPGGIPVGLWHDKQDGAVWDVFVSPLPFPASTSQRFTGGPCKHHLGAPQLVQLTHPGVTVHELTDELRPWLRDLPELFPEGR